MRQYFLYRHVRLDTQMPFYIGVGTVPKQHFETSKSKFGRAYNTYHRSDFWHRITSKTDYRVDIMLISENKNFICSKEMYFIDLYGRRCLGKGTLVNIQEGGDDFGKRGSCKEETKKKISNSHNKIPAHVYKITGEYVGYFKSQIEIVLKLNLTFKRIKKVLNGEASSTMGYAIFPTYQGDTIAPILPSPLTPSIISCYDENMNKLKTFSNLREACEWAGVTKMAIQRAYSNKSKRCKKLYWKKENYSPLF